MKTNRLSQPPFSILITGLILLSLLLTGAAPVAAQQTAAPPALVAVTPDPGVGWNGSPVTWNFDRAVETANESISPELEGSWAVSDSAVTFAPAGAPAAETRYTLRFDAFPVGEPAASESFELTLTGASPLRVTATQPTDGATEIGIDSRIVVSFNRPVVPLTGVDEQASLPQPLTIDPPLEGTGEWLGTSIYSFTPATGLAGATDYRVTVQPLTAVGGEVLDEAYSFGFSTAEPIIIDSQPQGEGVSPGSVVTVRFSQPMDRASTEAYFLLQDSETYVDVEGEFGWNALSTTLTFTPTQPLEFGAEYEIIVGADAMPASLQGSLRSEYSSLFRVVPLPSIVRTTPAGGATNVLPDQAVIIRFASPMSRTLLMDAITISPLLTTTTVYSYYNEYDGELRIEWFKQANTEYSVTVGAEAEDYYGNTLGQETVLNFTTGDYSPFVQVGLERYTQFTPNAVTNVSLYYRNMDELEVSLARLPVQDFIGRFHGENAWNVWETYELPDRSANLVWTRTYTTTDVRNETYERILTLDDGEGNPLLPGLYVVEAKLPPAPPANDGTVPRTHSLAVVLISNTNILLKKSTGGDSIAWLTAINSGEPVAEQRVDFYALGNEAGSATSDADGIARMRLTLPPEAQWNAMVAVVGRPGDETFAVASTDWSTDVATWDFGINGGYNLDEWQSVFYTERPIYRPGQTVYWKGIVRRFVDNEYLLPDLSVLGSLAMTITVNNDRGDTVLKQIVPISDLGTVSGSFDLAPDAFTGWYYMQTELPLGPNSNFYGGTGFQVASYEKPEFEISLTPSQEEYAQGETISVTLQADYYSGGALANAPVTWRVIANPYTFSWDDAPKGRWFTFAPFDPEAEEWQGYNPNLFYGLTKEGAGKTNADGSFTLTLPADLGESLQSQSWYVDMTVQSPTNQFVNAAVTLPIHLGDYYIGLSPQLYVAAVGEESAIDMITLSPQREPVGGVDVEAVVYEYKWSSVQEKAGDGRFLWQTSVERTPVFTDTLRTDSSGMATLRWTPEKGGQYQIVARAADGQENLISSATFLWVSDSSNGFVAWPRENNNRIELVADKRTYEPGDTAKILVPNPFTGTVQALITLEQAGVVEAQVITLAGSSRTIDVPITVDHIPNVFVGVVLVKGVDESSPTPAIRMGYVQLDVDTAAKELAIDVETSLLAAEPGDTVTYTLSISDEAGNPVPDVEVSVGLVDKALNALATSMIEPLVNIFYRVRPLGVTTGATLIINRDLSSQQLSEGAKGGGGGGGDGAMIDLREEFPDTAFWRANLVTDADGRIVFAVTLPDNLTTWELTARAVSADTLVGNTIHDLRVSKDLQVRPLLPRFFTAGDRARIGAVVLNTTDTAAQAGTLTLELEGATLDSVSVAELSLNANAGRTFDFPITIPDESTAVTLTFAAAAGDMSDAVRVVLPVLRYESPEVVATAGVVEAFAAESRPVVESVLLPADATDRGELTVRLEPSLAAGTLEGLTFLKHYPYECNEQTVSRFLPNLFTVRALQKLGINDADLESELSFQLGVGLQKLVSRQNPDGGWGYWQGEESTPFITAYVLWGLSSAQELGYDAPEGVLDRAVEYLDRTFVAPAEVEENWQLNEMAFAHMVLAQMGEGDPGRMSTLFDVRERLAHYGRAYLALALAALHPGDTRIATLLDDLAGSANRSATGAFWQEETTDWQTLNTDTRTTAIVLGTFAQLQPENPLLPNVVRWLMEERRDGMWAGTQENAWAILALTDWMAATGDLDANYTWDVALNGESLDAGRFDAASLTDPVTLRVAVADLLRGEANALRFSRGEGPGRLYYTTALRTWEDATAVAPRDRGIVVDRRFSIEGEPVNRAQVGDIISVTVTLIAPTSLHHLRVDIPIPAGVDIIDPNLNNAPQYDEYGNPLIRYDWNAWNPTFKDYRDDKVAVFDTFLPAGTYEYSFLVRAAVPGEFRVLPAYAELMYFTEIWGRSGGDHFTVTE